MKLSQKQKTEILALCGEVNRAGYQYGYHAGRGDVIESMMYRDREKEAMLGINKLFERWENDDEL